MRLQNDVGSDDLTLQSGMFAGMPRVLMSAIDPERHFFGTTSGCFWKRIEGLAFRNHPIAACAYCAASGVLRVTNQKRLAKRRLFQSWLILIQILVGNVIFRDLVSVDFPGILIVGFLDSRYRIGFKGISFFHQLIDAFRIGLLGARQTFQVSRLHSGLCIFSVQGKLERLRAAG
jgi:hypothetical protein